MSYTAYTAYRGYLAIKMKIRIKIKIWIKIMIKIQIKIRIKINIRIKCSSMPVTWLHGAGRNDFTYGKQVNISKYIKFRTT
jgi:hypothetical protein